MELNENQLAELERIRGWACCFEPERRFMAEIKVAQLKESLKEQLSKRGYAFRGMCDAVPDDIRRAFIALDTPCDEIDKASLGFEDET